MGTRPRPGLKVAQRAALGSVEDSESIGDTTGGHQNGRCATKTLSLAPAFRQHMLTLDHRQDMLTTMTTRTATDLAGDLDSTDPAVGLRAVAALSRLLEQLEALHVRNARSKGWSWQDIADSLGVTKQTVHRKHARR
jgi:hypothetical protein